MPKGQNLTEARRPANPDSRDTPSAAPTESLLAAIVESSDDAIVSKDLNGVITSWNRGAELIFGYSPDEVIGKSITIIIPQERLQEEPRILEQIRKGEKIDHFETVRRRKDGSQVEVSLSVSPVRNSAGEIIGASKIARNISDRKFATRQMSRLVAIVESSDDAIIGKDLDGIITTWNRGAEALFGYTADEAIGESVTILIPRDRIDEEPEILSRIRSGLKVDHYETIRRRKDGRLINVSLSVSPIFDAKGDVVGASKIARDISDRLAAESDRRDKEMLRRLLEAQESERNRIARDLHDHLGQKMTALRLKLENLFLNTPRGDEVEELINEVREMASGIDRDINFLSWELRPTELEDLGIEPALRSYVHEWSVHYQIRADFQSTVHDEPNERLAREAETNLYRFLQEALNNILKHAEAGSVEVMYIHRDREILLAIEDDGRGFDPDDIVIYGSSRRHLGLTSMRERIALMNGTLEIDSAPGEGTRLLARMPFVAAEPENGNGTNGSGNGHSLNDSRGDA